MAHDQFYDEPSGEYQTYPKYGLSLRKVGIDKPKVQYKVDIKDNYAWARQKAANDLGVDVNTLPDEPDEMSDHSDQQGFDQWKEEE